MEAQVILSVVAQGLALIFIFTMGVVWLIGARKDGKLTKDEIAPVAIIGVFIFMMIMNGMRPIDTPPRFDSSVVLIVLGSVLLLAGIDIAKLKGLINKEKK